MKLLQTLMALLLISVSVTAQASDSRSSLEWYPTTLVKNWADADSFCTNSLIKGKNGWRLPTKYELIDIYQSGVPNRQQWPLMHVWTSTPDFKDGGYYIISMYTGVIGSIIDTSSTYVYCVC
jgi:Protein of unknown function (DUF1566)